MLDMNIVERNYAFRQNNLYYFIYTVITALIFIWTFGYVGEWIITRHDQNDRIVDIVLEVYMAFMLMYGCMLWYGNELFICLMTMVSGYPYKKVKVLFDSGI